MLGFLRNSRRAGEAFARDAKAARQQESLISRARIGNERRERGITEHKKTHDATLAATRANRRKAAQEVLATGVAQVSLPDSVLHNGKRTIKSLPIAAIRAELKARDSTFKNRSAEVLRGELRSIAQVRSDDLIEIMSESDGMTTPTAHEIWHEIDTTIDVT